MEERIRALEEKVDLLEWKVELLQDHVELKGAFNILTELNITRKQFSQIIDVIQKYSDDYKDIWDNNKHNRHSFEREFADINDVFTMNTQAVEIILKDIAEEEDCPYYKLLFVRLYGHMPKYRDTFPEIVQNKN